MDRMDRANPRVNRRRFLALAGGAAAGAILAACGGTSAATDTAKPVAPTAVPVATAAAVPLATAAATIAPTRSAASAPSSTTAGSITGTPAMEQRLVIEAVEYGFKTMSSIPGGPTTVQLRNLGREAHHAQLLLLNDGVTLEQFAAASKRGPEGIFPLVAAFVGGVGVTAPDASAEVVLDLKAGRYILGCFISGDDHIPHVGKGMVLPLTVTVPSATVSAPVVTGTITMSDFTFEMPATLPAGRILYRVVNQGPQTHEWNLIQLAPGKTVADAKAFFDPPPSGPPPGPPPGKPIGGMNGLSKGLAGIAVLDLAPGEYAAMCIIPDQSSPDHAPHLHLGMIKGFTVT